MQTAGIATRSALRSGFLGGNVYPRAISKPATFPYAPTFAQVQLGPTLFNVSLDPATLIPATAATLYANAARADNTGNGQSGAAAEQAIWAALNDVVTTTTLYVLGSTDRNNPTVYGWTKAWRVGTAADLAVKVVSDFTTLAPGWAISSTALVAGDGELGTWASTGGGTPNTYVATLATAPDRVIDALVPDANGVPTKLTLRSSIATVDAAPGSYWHSAGNLYVRTADSRAPSFPTLRPLRAASVNGLVNGGKTIYIERLSFEGGDAARAFYAQDGNVCLVDCDVNHGPALGFDMNTIGALTNVTRTAHLFRCRFIANGGDGCGYTAAGTGMTLRGVEVDCIYARNSGGGADQGGSAHFTAGNTEVSVIRLNPTCTTNKSQGFADVGGCFVWIQGGSVTGEVSGIYCGDAGATWVHGTVLSGNTTDLVTDAAGGTIYVAGATWATNSGAGTEGAVYAP